ncbi:hypothetical protein ACWD4V_18275 [Streptomyces tsukubensis]
MAASPPEEPRCGSCGKTIKHADSARGGRPREYCDRKCRSRAQRRRDRERRTSRPPSELREVLTRDLTARAQHLHTAGTQMELKELLELVRLVHSDADRLAAVAVDTARHEGRDWADIGTAAGLSQAAARARWGGLRIERLLSQHTPPQQTTAIPATTPETAEPGTPTPAPTALNKLGTALRTLHTTSGVTARRVSFLTRLPLPAVTALMESRTTASWPEIYMLSHALGGDPQDMRLLWLHTRGIPETGTPGDSPDLFSAALRGAHLAAGIAHPAAGRQPATRPPSTHDAPRPCPVPGWTTVNNLLLNLGAEPSDYRALWKAAARHTDGKGHHGS